jgi:acylphosphatase
VQQVGYREHVKKCAQRMRVKGCVRNLDDGDVEIYCEMDPGDLEGFKQGLVYERVRVDRILVYEEGSKEYGNPDVDFSRFRVIRDEDEVAETLSVMTAAGLKMLEKLDNLSDKVDSGNKMLAEKIENGNKMLGEKIDSGNKMLAEKIENGNRMLGEKIDSGNKMLGEKIDAMHTDMNVRFDRMEERYGVIFESIRSFLEEFRVYNTRLEEHNKKLDLILEKLVEVEKKPGKRRRKG